jgi:hypothetical protein
MRKIIPYNPELVAFAKKTAQQHDFGRNSPMARNKEQKTRRQLQWTNTH